MMIRALTRGEPNSLFRGHSAVSEVVQIKEGFTQKNDMVSNSRQIENLLCAILIRLSDSFKCMSPILNIPAKVQYSILDYF